MNTPAPADAEIVRRYSHGQSTGEIARALNMRLIDVIGRVRELDLAAPSMGVRRSGDAMVHRLAETGTVCAIDARPAGEQGDAAHAGLASTRTPALGRPTKRVCVPGVPEHAAYPDFDGEDDDGLGDLVQKPGCPRGWLVTEAQFARLFKGAGTLFEDAVFARKPRKLNLASLTGQAANGSKVPGFRDRHARMVG